MVVCKLHHAAHQGDDSNQKKRWASHGQVHGWFRPSASQRVEHIAEQQARGAAFRHDLFFSPTLSFCRNVD